MWKPPKDSDKYHWTEHAKMKMRQYGLSAQRVTRVVRSPLRVEESVAGQNTIAAMQPQSTHRDANGEKTWNNEIWVMYKCAKKKKIAHNPAHDALSNDSMTQFLSSMGQDQKQIHIISTWRYPGKTEPGESLPDQILDEIAEIR